MILRTFTAIVLGLKAGLKSLQTGQIFAVVLAGLVFLTTSVNQNQRSEALGQAIRERIEETDQSDRPKTTGEFLDEARGDVPLDERVKNITRDSVEAFKELGREYAPDLQSGAQKVRDAATGNTVTSQ